MRRNILLLVASLIVSLALFEVGLRLAPPAGIKAKLPDRPSDARVLATDEFSSRVVTNRLGLRESREFFPDHPGVVRVAAVGDSFTWGWGVDNADTYPAVLESLLKTQTGRAVEVVNVGKSGDNLAGYVRLLHHHALPLKPDVVAMEFLVGNDCPVEWPLRAWPDATVAERVAAHVRDARGRPPTFYLGRLFSMTVAQPVREYVRDRRDKRDAPLAPDILRRLAASSPARAERVARLERDGWIAKGRTWTISPWLIAHAIESPEFEPASLFLDDATRPAMEAQWRICEGLIEAMRGTVEKAGARFVLLILPSAVQVDGRALAFRRALGFPLDERALGPSEAHARLARFCARTGTACVDTLDAARAATAEGRRLFYVRDGHPTKEGYALIARQAAERLTPTIAALVAERAAATAAKR